MPKRKTDEERDAAMRDLLHLLKFQSHMRGIKCIYEDVGYHRQGNNAQHSATFANHCGFLRGLLVCLFIDHEKVTPKEWQKVCPSVLVKPKRGASAKEKAKYSRDRKNEIKAQMQALYPHLKITLATADALGILTWARM
jgi:hypothetical protein